MAIQFYTAILDTHIAPGVSTFTVADIPDMASWSKELLHWIANFSKLGADTFLSKPPMKRLRVQLLAPGAIRILRTPSARKHARFHSWRRSISREAMLTPSFIGSAS